MEEGMLGYVKIFFALICAVLLLWIVAESFPGILTGLASPSTFTPSVLKVTSGSVLLSFVGGPLTWGVGNYAACTVSTSSTTCLQALVTSQPIISPLFVIVSIVAIMCFAILLLLYAKKANE